MTYGRISKKQQEILDYMKNEILNRGFPPSVREICEAVNLKSTSSVHSHLEALEKNGYIRRDATKPRAIEIIDDNFNLVRREVVNVPLVAVSYTHLTPRGCQCSSCRHCCCRTADPGSGKYRCLLSDPS